MGWRLADQYQPPPKERVLILCTKRKGTFWTYGTFDNGNWMDAGGRKVSVYAWKGGTS